MPHHPDDPEVTRRRERWVADACQLLGLDTATVDAVTPDLLRMVAGVAHGPARPAGPITALLVGLAAAAPGNTTSGPAAGTTGAGSPTTSQTMGAGAARTADADAIRARIAEVEALLDGWQA